MNGSEKREGYDVALVCENGHEVNAASRWMPEANAKHCDKCGAKATDACPTAKRRSAGFIGVGRSAPRHTSRRPSATIAANLTPGRKLPLRPLRS